MDENRIVEITSIKQLLEMSSMSGGSVQGVPVRQNKESDDEKVLREHIRSKLIAERKKVKKSENQIRALIRAILSEGDIADTHPHRSTGINTLEDVLKKSIPTLRVDYKKLTTDPKQRESFRAHIVKAIIDALRPETVNAQYLQGGGSGASSLLDEPTGAEGESDEEDNQSDDIDDLDLDLDDDEKEALQEVEIELEDDDKKIAVEDDDEPSPEEEFGGGLEDMDETGRNHAYTSYRKISQYILDAYDSLANPKDKKIFLDYLVTNIKLYFDKFEDELQTTVEEPSTPEYDKAKKES